MKKTTITAINPHTQTTFTISMLKPRGNDEQDPVEIFGLPGISYDIPDKEFEIELRRQAKELGYHSISIRKKKQPKRIARELVYPWRDWYIGSYILGR